MAGIRINDLPFEANPSADDLIPIHDQSSDRERKITVGSISQAVEAEIVDRIVKVVVQDEGELLNPTGSSTLNFIGPGVTATANSGDPNVANILIRNKKVANLLYVAEDGDDSNDGLTLDNAKASIRSALREAGQFYHYAELAQAPTYPQLLDLEANANGEVKRYFNLLKDAGNTIALSRDFIVEEAWGFASANSSNPNFTGQPEKGKRDLGMILDSVVADIKNGGNLSTVRAAQAFYNKAGSLDYIENIIGDTKAALSYMRGCAIAAMRNWSFQARSTFTAGASNITISTELGAIGVLEGMEVSGSGIVPGTTVTAVLTASSISLSNPVSSSQTNTALTFTFPLAGYYNVTNATGLSLTVDPTLPNDTGHLTRGESECSSVAHALVNYFSILEAILDNGKDFVATTFPPEGVTVFVKAGEYVENNPLEVHAHSSVIGDNLRIVTVKPQNLDKDLFHVNNGSYLAGMSYRTVANASFPKAIVAFPDSGAGQIYESPYTQNCTNFCPDSTGLRVDGSKSMGLRSMVLDAYTQYNAGGIGCHVLEKGYTQLVSMFTICCDKSVLAESGSFVSLTNSNSDFGNYGLFSEGLVPSLRSFQAVGDYPTNSFIFTIGGADIESFPPYLGLVAEPIEPYFIVSEIRIDNPGSGYTVPPSFVFPAPLGVNGIPADASVILSEGSVAEINFISEGGQYTEAQVSTFVDPAYGGLERRVLDGVSLSGGDGTGFAVTVFVEPVYYTVKSVKPFGSNFRVEFEENVPFPVANGSVFRFFQPSTIVSSSHTFEYIGGGTEILSALPEGGAEFFPEQETVALNGGRVATTSSDQGGNFRIGDGIFINNARGTIEGEDFERSLFNIMSPFIIALS